MQARQLLRLNALFSGLSGATLFLLQRPLGEAFGVGRAPIAVVGVALLIYGADLGIAAVRNGLRRPLVMLFASADAAWVLAALTVLMVWPHELSVAGRLALAATIAPVAAFAVLQFRAARRLA